MGPCNEWQETICTSSGRYFSKASFSGALTEVCPATIAPTLVAGHQNIRGYVDKRAEPAEINASKGETGAKFDSYYVEGSRIRG